MPEILPEHADVVVVGGGVIGCNALYHLVTAGVQSAILLELIGLADEPLGTQPLWCRLS